LPKPGGRQKASGQSSDCRLSSPGGDSDRNYDWRIDATVPRVRREDRKTDRKKKGRPGIVWNERTWASGSALSRKPSRRSGPIKRVLRTPTSDPFSFSSLATGWPFRLHFIISTNSSIWLRQDAYDSPMISPWKFHRI